MVIKGSLALRLSICRRPVTDVLNSEIKMKMPDGLWEPFSFRLLSNRNIEFEKLSPPQVMMPPPSSPPTLLHSEWCDRSSQWHPPTPPASLTPPHPCSRLSPPQYAGEIQARVAQSLNLLEDRGEQVQSSAQPTPHASRTPHAHPRQRLVPTPELFLAQPGPHASELSLAQQRRTGAPSHPTCHPHPPEFGRCSRSRRRTRCSRSSRRS